MPPRPPNAALSASTCATTGRRHCGATVSTSAGRPRGAPRGCYPYLPPDAQDRLFDHITALSAPGSRLATEHVPDPDAFTDERLQRITQRWQRAGFDLNAADLFYRGERSVVVDYLNGHGWQVAAHAVRDLYARHGFEFPEELTAAFGDLNYVAATLT